MDQAINNRQFEDCQRLLWLIKAMSLSAYAWTIAARSYHRAKAGFQTLARHADEAMELNNLALVFLDQREYSEATSLYEQAAAIYRTIGIGIVYTQQGNHKHAVDDAL